MDASRDEQGFAVVLAISVVATMAILGAVLLTTGEHADRTSARGANWDRALHVAEAGVQEAMVLLGEHQGVVPAPFTGTSADGSYEVSITALGRSQYRIEASGSVGDGAGLVARRDIEVVLGPPLAFEHAMFSLTDITTKNNNEVDGDVWANGSVVVHNNDIVRGSIVAATGSVLLRNNSRVEGDVLTGGTDGNGYAVRMMNGARIEGDVVASSTVPACAGEDPAQYGVGTAGTVDGSVTTWGWVSGVSVGGSTTSSSCSSALATRQIPPYTFHPVTYDEDAITFASPAEFQSYLAIHGHALAGTFVVEGAGSVDLGGVAVAGDTTIVAWDAALHADGIGAANNDDKILVLASFYQPAPGTACTSQGGNPLDCAIGIKNHFAFGDGTAVLLYAPNGPVSFKNNTDFIGAVYAKDIVLKNNMSVVYDPRVARVVGFGEVTLEPVSWIEHST